MLIMQYMAAGTRIPVQASGHIPGIGNLDIQLDEVEFWQVIGIAQIRLCFEFSQALSDGIQESQDNILLRLTGELLHV